MTLCRSSHVFGRSHKDLFISSPICELVPGYWNLRCYHLRKNGRVVNMIAPSDWAAVVKTVDAVKDRVREEKANIIHLTQLTIHTVVWNVASSS